MAHAPDDRDLMVRARDGQRDAFVLLVHRHQAPLLNFFRRMGVYTDAEDMVQETFLRLFAARERYRPTAKFTTFLYTIARRVRADRLRKSMRAPAYVAATESAAASEGDESDRAADRLDVQRALDGLSEKLRAVVVLSAYQGLRYAEIAAILGIPEGTVKSRMSLAMGQLREILDV